MMFDLDSTTLSCHATMTESLRRTRRACDSRGGYTYTRPRGGREVRTQISARVLFCLSDSAMACTLHLFGRIFRENFDTH